MSNDLPRLTEGNVGKVRFDHMNRVMDATRAVESAIGGGAGAAPVVLRSMFAKVLASSGTVGSYTTWTWERVGVNSSSSGVSGDATLIESADYTAGGKAIDLAGTVAANDLVLIHEMIGLDNIRYFAIVSGGGGSSSPPGFALTITATSGSAAPWTYTVGEYTVNSSGALVSTGNTGTMFNMYEVSPYGHGQDLTLDLATLTPSALTGTVFGCLSMIDGVTRVYVCDAPNPMVPTCVGGGGGSGLSQPQIMARGLGG